MISHIKCSLFGSLLFTLLICIKICKPVETSAEINKPNGNINNIKNLNRLKQLYFLQSLQSNNFVPSPIKMQMLPPSFSKSSSSSSTKQKYVSSRGNENTNAEKLKDNFGRKYKSNNVDLHQMKSNEGSSLISPGVFNSKYFSTYMRPYQTSNVLSKFNDFSSQSAEQKNFKNRAMLYPFNIINKFENPKSPMYTEQQKYNFSESKKSKNLLEDILDPELAHVESLSKILKRSDSNLGNRKIIHLKEKTVVAEWENGRNSTKISSERLHNIYQMTGPDIQQMQLDYRGKMNMNKETKGSSTGLKNIAEFSDKFSAFDSQKENIPDINKANYKKINYGGNTMELQSIKDFNKLQSFQNQKNSFNLENNFKPESLYFINNRGNPRFRAQYLENAQTADKNRHIQKGDMFGLHKAGQQSNWEKQNDFSKNIDKTEIQMALEGFNNKFQPVRGQKNGLNIGNNRKLQNTYLTENNENSKFASQYLENSQKLENNEDKSDIRKKNEFRLHKLGQQPNWKMQNSASRNITVEENSDAILEKENGESYKSSQTNYIQIFKKNSMHKSLNRNHKALRVNGLEHHKQKSRIMSLFSAGMLMLIVLIILLLAMFLKCICVVLIMRREAIKSTNKFPISKIHPIIIKSPNKRLTCNANIKNRSPNSECVTPNQHSICLRKGGKLRSPSKLNTDSCKTTIEIEASSKSSNEEFSGGRIQIDIQGSDINHLLMPNSLQDPADACIKHASMKSNNDSFEQRGGIQYEKGNLQYKTETLCKEYYYRDSETSATSHSSERESVNEYGIENSVGSPWNLHLRNVKTCITFKGTQYKANQNDPVNYSDKEFARSNSENVKHDEYLKEVANVKFSSPKYSNKHFHSLKTSDADLASKKNKNEYFTSKRVHDYSYNTDSESLREMQSPSDLNYLSLKDEIGSPWHRNLVHLRTKSNILFHNDNSNAMAFDKIESNSTHSITSARTVQKTTFLSDVQTANKMQLCQSNVPSQYSINDRTDVTREIHISPVMNSDLNV